MKNLKTQIKISFWMGMLTIPAAAAAHLALTDISHMEPDLTLEWSVLQVCALVIAAFTVMAMITLRRVYKSIQ
jgi:hypothetical protein